MKYQKRTHRKRLSCDIPQTLFDKLYEMAKLRNITITKYVMSAIIAKLKLEN